MEEIFKACSKIRPLTVALNSFMAGVFFSEKMYWTSALMAVVIICNLFYLKNKE